EIIEHAGDVRFIDPHGIMTRTGEVIRAAKIIICTGGVSRRLTVPGADLTVTPEDAFGLTAVPRSMVVIGGGMTGLQVASIFNAFGTSIDLFEAGERILKTEDADVSGEVTRAFREDGIRIHERFGAIQSFARSSGGGVTMQYASGETITAEFI